MEFKDANNPWSVYALNLLFCQVRAVNWKWKSNDNARQQRQRIRFHALLGGLGLQQEDKIAVAGWMLSEMLSEVPA